MSSLDPELARYFEQLAAQFPLLPADPTPLERRSRYWALCGLGRTPWPDSVTVNDVILQLACGPTPVRLYYGHDGSDEAVPVIIYYHGGGWVVGDPDTHGPTCARLAAEANAIVISVDYPLAPEHGWQAITDACYQAAIAIIADQTDAPIALAGDSAGAHLAAVTALRLRDGGSLDSVALQALIYPAIAPRFDSASYAEYALGPGLTQNDMRWYWRHYAGADAELRDYRIAPDRADSLAGLPPAYVITAGLDPLRDDGLGYADALRAAGVSVSHDRFDTLPHGYLRMGKYSRAVDQAIGHGNRRIGQLLRSGGR